MREEAHDRAAAQAAWRELRDEFDRWAEAGRTATLWWRDDDATAPSDRLDRLLALAGVVPLALAVIPAAAEPGLAAALPGGARVAVLQHGWRHANHGGAGKKSEFPAGRDPAAVAAELAAGRGRLQTLFGGRTLAVLAPPWNRFDDGFLSLLKVAGLAAISRLGSRRAPAPAPGIAEANVHVDLVAWRGDRGFVGAAAAVAGLTRQLAARRGHRAEPAEPTGMLTHHLIHDRATEAFLAELFDLSLGHPAARWLDAAEVFA